MMVNGIWGNSCPCAVSNMLIHCCGIRSRGAGSDNCKERALYGTPQDAQSQLQVKYINVNQPLGRAWESYLGQLSTFVFSGELSVPVAPQTFTFETLTSIHSRGISFNAWHYFIHRCYSETPGHECQLPNYSTMPFLTNDVVVCSRQAGGIMHEISTCVFLPANSRASKLKTP